VSATLTEANTVLAELRDVDEAVNCLEVADWIAHENTLGMDFSAFSRAAADALRQLGERRSALLTRQHELADHDGRGCNCP